MEKVPASLAPAPLPIEKPVYPAGSRHERTLARLQEGDIQHGRLPVDALRRDWHLDYCLLAHQRRNLATPKGPLVQKGR